MNESERMNEETKAIKTLTNHNEELESKIIKIKILKTEREDRR